MRRLVPWLLLLLAAAAPRLAWVHRLAVAGDEIHPLVKAITLPFSEIVSTFAEADNCIPITLWNRMLITTVGLEEIGFRFLSLVPGILLVPLLWIATRRLLPLADRVPLVLLASLSPLLVYWSREARPYAAVAFLGTLGAFSLLCYVTGSRRRRWLVLFVASQVTMHFFSLTSLPFTAGLCLAGAIVEGLDAEAPRRLRFRRAAMFLLLGPVTLAGTALVLLPALPSLLEVLSTKQPTGSVLRETVFRSFEMVTGWPASHGWTVSRALLVVPAALLGVGAVALLRRSHRFGLAAAVTLAAPATGHLLLHAKLIEAPEVFVRYQAAVVPSVLVLLVYGWSVLRVRLVTRWPGAAALSAAAGVLLVSVLYLVGPLQEARLPKNPFGLRASTLRVPLSLGKRGDPEKFPAFYRELRPGDTPEVIEWPITPRARFLVGIYQVHHGVRMTRCMNYDRLHEDHPRLMANVRFRSLYTGIDDVRDRAPAGAWLVMHRDPVGERILINAEEILPGKAQHRRPRADAARELARRYFGPPIHEDRWIEVFQKDRDDAGSGGATNG